MGTDSLASARLALDVKGLDGLKRAAARNPEAQLKHAAREFEALFLGHMLKSMRKAGFQSDLVDNRNVRFYQSMFDQQLAQNLAGKGLGIAQMLVRQLSRGAEPTTAGQSGDVIGAQLAAIPRGTPRALDAMPSVASEGAADQPVPATAFERIADALAAQMSGSTDESAEAPHSAAGRFVQRFGAVARTAAKASGVSPLLILAQAALETGWGKHTASKTDGSNSHNLFGIKAGSSWSGAVGRNQTHEYVDGQRVAVRDRFRGYASYADSFADHARLIGQSPRYAAVRDADTPEQAARALQASGYATDPHYADKLIAIMKQIGNVVGL